MAQPAPNLFLIGAMKSGTSTLYAHLNAHPQIVMSAVKEPNYFTLPAPSAADRADYLALFSAAGGATWRGEASTRYSKLPYEPGVARRIHDFDPQARVVYIMRDPFERALSQYRHQVSRGRETRPFSAAVGRGDYLLNSYYAYQLRAYLDYFDRDALYLLALEDFAADPRASCRRLFAWLGVDSDFEPPDVGRVYNSSPTAMWPGAVTAGSEAVISRMPLRPGARQLLRGAYHRGMTALFGRRRSIDFDAPQMQDDLYQARYVCHHIMRSWNQELTAWTGFSCAAWPTNELLPVDTAVRPEKIDELIHAVDAVLWGTAVAD